jgi:hypothetical protein
MSVYVDAAVHRWRGRLWCHLFSPDIDELHDFARRLGLQRGWFQDPARMAKVSWPHYDTVDTRRMRAIDMGAVPLDRHRTSIMSRVVIDRWRGTAGTPHALDPLALHRRTGSPRLPELEAWLNSLHPEYGCRSSRPDGADARNPT